MEGIVYLERFPVHLHLLLKPEGKEKPKQKIGCSSWTISKQIICSKEVEVPSRFLSSSSFLCKIDLFSGWIEKAGAVLVIWSPSKREENRRSICSWKRCGFCLPFSGIFKRKTSRGTRGSYEYLPLASVYIQNNFKAWGIFYSKLQTPSTTDICWWSRSCWWSTKPFEPTLFQHAGNIHHWGVV